jgi:hypothetical protein
MTDGPYAPDPITDRHMRFVGATIYCPAKPGREKLPDEHRYADGYICPYCEAVVPPSRVR